ncbi:hypothetical protein [Scleromatobacter humisilvae]|uniref:Uncharacterized protein n=1 Tax=Scleromatobacter humisilvae TaxID=2897159 RepID=A0A9X1YJG4_9BURK|nr:hypothetical protein [Scleromatobacter humisilvae]MCK9687278.1 hypothetical protein [Scleromatobacter humisilvae]
MCIAEIISESRTRAINDDLSRADALEAGLRAAGVLDVDGYFTQSDDDFYAELV